MSKTVITYGTFDLFHRGHVSILQRLKALGDRLIVAVSSDEFNALKGKRSLYPYEDRVAIVSALSCVDQVIREEALARFGSNRDEAQVFFELLRGHVLPNLLFNVDETNSRRDKATAQVQDYFIVSKNESIIHKHDKVTEEHLQGMETRRVPLSIPARLSINVPSIAGREDWIPVRISEGEGGYTAEPIFFESNFIFRMVKGDGLARIPEDANGLQAGEIVQVRLI